MKTKDLQISLQECLKRDTTLKERTNILMSAEARDTSFRDKQTQGGPNL